MAAELRAGDPRKVGPYWLLGRLGAGGMGQVFLGRSPGGRQVAVKLVRAELAEQAEFRVRFAQEVAAARTVSGLFTAPVVDADLDAPVPWLATAYVAGPSLADAVARHGPLPVTSVLALAAGLAEGLGAIHAAGIVHRDLKPSNVLLADDGPRVIDFGISRAAEASTLTGTGLIIGSPGFMSPEQAQGHAAGPPSDVFSLGAVLTFAATGEGPFGTGSTPTLLYRVVFDPPATGGLPGGLRPLVERCLAKDPQQRPSTGQLLSELNAHPAAGWLPPPITQGFTSPAPPDPVPSGAVTADGPPARPTTEPAAPRSPFPPGVPGSPSTITAASARTPDAAARPQPGGNARRPGPGRRRRLAWALITAGVLAVAVAAAVALTGMGGQRHQPAAGRAQATSPAFSRPTTTASATQRAAPTSTSAPAQTSSPSSIAPAAPTSVFWTAAVLSSHYEQNAQRMVKRLHQSGFDGEYWRSTTSNSVLQGYWVVTNGRFPDQADASARAKLLQSAGFTGAYARCVGSRQACPPHG
jgi:serine/threonine protein kinase